ncbi:MAG: TAXI family TRAP transporter solute-binding subunit [Verrucomicrobiota bacterium]
MAVGLFVWWSVFLRGAGKYTLATGEEGGTYAVFGRVLEERVEGRIRLEARNTQGTGENLRLLTERSADFAIVQGSESPTEGVRTVCPLYQDVLHVLVREESEIQFLRDLRGMRISVGPKESGMRQVALEILKHFGVDDFELVEGRGIEVRGLLDSDVDAVLRVTALHSEVIREAVGSGGIRFIGLGEAAGGLTSRFPYLKQAEVPAFVYPCSKSREGALPKQTVQTVGVSSFLVCREGLSTGAVYEMTEGVYENRNPLLAVAPEAMQIQEHFERDSLIWPLHEGARKFFRRQEPGFFERYAEVIALLMSVAATSWAFLGALSKWSSKQKRNRIDDYYLEVASAFLRIEEAELSQESLEQEESRLKDLRSRAFKDLANEKLKADESFRILQDQLALCLGEVRQLRRD